MSTPNITLPSDVLFSPSDASRAGLANIDHRRKNQHLAVPFGVSRVDEVYLPLLPGELETFISRPGNGKTSVMINRARRRALQLSKMNENRTVVIASCEQTIEEVWALGIAAESGVNVSSMARGVITDAEWVIIEEKAVDWGTMPIWFIGPSRERRSRRPRITADVIIEAVLDMQNRTGIDPDIVFVDYLQLLKSNRPNASKTVEMADTLEDCKDGALDTGCGWSVNVQARREVDAQALPIPGPDSGQWTSAIEQFSDRQWSAVRPIKYRKPGEMFGSRLVQGNEVLLTLWKQKLGKDGVPFWLYLDPAYNRLEELDKGVETDGKDTPYQYGERSKRMEKIVGGREW